MRILCENKTWTGMKFFLYSIQFKLNILLYMQVERPVTLKKDGIQTRNRKLSAKSKKKRAGMADFFRSGREKNNSWILIFSANILYLFHLSFFIKRQ